MTSESLEDLIQKWLLWDKDQTTGAEIRSLCERGALSGSSAMDAQGELENRLRNRIQFGTAGLRGRMQAGFAFMNCLTVIQASQGIAQHLVASSSSLRQLSVIIGHDSRHNSARFARLAANAFRSKGITVHMFEDHVPTPLVAFGVRFLAVDAGIMITASHNPAQDNGYKVYGANGAQINNPVDEHIAKSILENLEPWEEAWDESDIVLNPPRFLPNIRGQYSTTLMNREHMTLSNSEAAKCPSGSYHTILNEAAKYPLIGVYTPMHGVGWAFVADIALQVNNCTLIPVPAQIEPDPDFPTVKFPNPEEHGALQLAFDTADEAGADMVFANDPDADRFAVAQKIDNSWRRFTGDQIGVLLADYLIENELQRKTDRKVVLLCSAVSSGMLKKMVEAAGSRFHFEETLTGFKWIGNRAKQLADKGFVALFGYEEALGYMFPEVSWDKDGIAAMSTFLCALLHWERQGHDSWSKLQWLYQKYGYHESINTYFTSPKATYTRDIFARIRASEAISQMRLGSYRIIKWRDVTSGTESGAWPNKLPVDRTSEMLKFHVVEAGTMATLDGPASEAADAKRAEMSFTIRASGTEPKIKLYLECSGSTQEVAVRHAGGVFSAIIREWISPFGQELRHSGTAISSSNRAITVMIT